MRYKITLDQLQYYTLVYEELQIYIPGNIDGKKIFNKLESLGYEDYFEQIKGLINKHNISLTITIYKRDKKIYWLFEDNDKLTFEIICG